MAAAAATVVEVQFVATKISCFWETAKLVNSVAVTVEEGRVNAEVSVSVDEIVEAGEGEKGVLVVVVSVLSDASLAPEISKAAVVNGSVSSLSAATSLISPNLLIFGVSAARGAKCVGTKTLEVVASPSRMSTVCTLRGVYTRLESGAG